MSGACPYRAFVGFPFLFTQGLRPGLSQCAPSGLGQFLEYRINERLSVFGDESGYQIGALKALSRAHKECLADRRHPNDFASSLRHVMIDPGDRLVRDESCRKRSKTVVFALGKKKFFGAAS